MAKDDEFVRRVLHVAAEEIGMYSLGSDPEQHESCEDIVLRVTSSVLGSFDGAGIQLPPAQRLVLEYCQRQIQYL